MTDLIEEVVFKLEDGRIINVFPYGESWTQSGATVPLDPEFLDEFWSLMVVFEMVMVDFPMPEDD